MPWGNLDGNRKKDPGVAQYQRHELKFLEFSTKIALKGKGEKRLMDTMSQVGCV